jgi:hypothetical protein
VHHQFPFYKVEAIRNGLKGTINHLLLQLGVELGQLVYSLKRVLRIWHAKRHLELKGFDEKALEIMLLHHQKFLHRLRPHLKFQSGAYR